MGVVLTTEFGGGLLHDNWSLVTGIDDLQLQVTEIDNKDRCRKTTSGGDGGFAPNKSVEMERSGWVPHVL